MLKNVEFCVIVFFMFNCHDLEKPFNSDMRSAMHSCVTLCKQGMQVFNNTPAKAGESESK